MDCAVAVSAKAPIASSQVRMWGSSLGRPLSPTIPHTAARPRIGHRFTPAMFFIGDPPWIDLDNLAKAILDAIKGYAFHDDAQVARLLVERRAGERERIAVTIRKLSDLSPWPRG